MRERHDRCTTGPGSSRARLMQALTGEPVTKPVFAVYDWFVKHRDIDWQSLFDLGLGQINHAEIVEYSRPNVEITEATRIVDGQERRDVYWRTDIGQLHEWYLGEWRQEYLIKDVQGYQIMKHALMDTAVTPFADEFLRLEGEVGNNGITVGQFRPTPLLMCQIHFAGLERFSLDIAERVPELMELIELMGELKLAEFRAAVQTPVQQIKLWENLSIETMGPSLYQEFLVPLYKRIFAILEGTDKKLQVHYDGKLRIIADQIAELPFDGLDSLTPPPEGDMRIAEARRLWPDKFFYLHPSLTWYSLPPGELVRNVENMAHDADPYRYCMILSEEVPPDWRATVPLVLDTLDHIAR